MGDGERGRYAECGGGVIGMGEGGRGEGGGGREEGRESERDREGGRKRVGVGGREG